MENASAPLGQGYYSTQQCVAPQQRAIILVDTGARGPRGGPAPSIPSPARLAPDQAAAPCPDEVVRNPQSLFRYHERVNGIFVRLLPSSRPERSRSSTSAIIVLFGALLRFVGRPPPEASWRPGMCCLAPPARACAAHPKTVDLGYPSLGVHGSLDELPQSSFHVV